MVCKTLLVLPVTIASGALKLRDLLVHINMQASMQIIPQACYRAAGYLHNHPTKSLFNWNFVFETNITETAVRTVRDKHFVLLCYVLIHETNH